VDQHIHGYFRKRQECNVVVSNVPKPPGGLDPPKVFGLSDAPNCLGLDKVPVDSLYASYVDPDGYSCAFAVSLQRKK